MDISRHKGPAYESEAANEANIRELDMSRSNSVKRKDTKTVEGPGADKSSNEENSKDDPVVVAEP